MRNVWLIARREYLERIRTRSFMIMTILIPVLMGGGLAASVLLAKHSKSDAHIVVVSNDEGLADALRDELQNGQDSEMRVDVISPPSAATRGNLRGMLRSKQIDGFLWVNPPSVPGERPEVHYDQGASADVAARTTVRNAVGKVLTREQLVRKGMTAKEVDQLIKPVDIASDEPDEANSVASFASAYVLFFLQYMVLMLYGMNVARSIIEEKTSRVFEVMLATVKTTEMMAGKVIGVGSVGLTQVAIWMMSAVLLTHTPVIERTMGPGMRVSISWLQVVAFLVYFLLGYLLYSAIAAALGAMTNSEQELQQMNMFLVLPLACCMLVLGAVVGSPDGRIATIFSMIPFCSPLIMYMRISLGKVHPEQIAISILLMVATIAAILWVAAKIYRVGVLMYGKKPSLPEILRWVKYS